MAKRLALVLLLVGCGGEGGDELGDELERFEQEQLDCRPVRVEGCVNAWNDRACFHVPAECAVQAEAEPASP